MRRPELSATAGYIAWYARHTPDATAVVAGGSHFNYRTVATHLVRCSRAMAAFGIGPGTIVGIRVLDRYLHLVLLLACEISGATAMPLSDADWSGNEIMMRYCDFVLTATGAGTDGEPRTIAVSHDLLEGDAASPVSEADMARLDRDIPPDRIVRIVLTSGSTGRPKAMPMTQATQQLRVVRVMQRMAHEVLPNPRYLCLYSPRVGSNYVRAISVLQHGGTVLFALGEHAARLIAIGAVNYASFAVGDIERLLPDARPPPAGHTLHLVVSGAAVTPRLRRRIAETLGVRVANGYASNETTTIATVDDNNVGTLCRGVLVKIVDESGRERPLGEPGMIRVKSETMVHGYFNDPALTRAAFFDGWFQPGDLGVMPEPGKLVVLGRADSMLNVGGVKVAPTPIEERIKRIDGVGDAIVMGVAGQNDVGILLAAVELGAQPPPPDVVQSIGRIVSQHVTRFVIMPMARLPRTEWGKIKIHDVEAAYHRSSERDLIVVG